jgi:uncharacterized membrane protein YbhN (UPF0104 family)
VRAVVLERVAGQTVQAVIAVALLFALPSPVRGYMPVATVGAIVAAVVIVLIARALARRGSTRWMRRLRRAGQDIRDGLFTRRNWLGVVVASTVVVAGHLATFVVAARAAGADAPLGRLIPLTLLALLAMGLPLNVAGWGPREGVAAWAFGAAGLTATQGVAAAVTYGVLVFAATLPGLVVLVVRWLRREPVVRELDLRTREPVAVGRRA